MKTAIWISVLLATITIASTVLAQVPETNTAIHLQALAGTPPTNSVTLLPLVEFHDVPITTAIENLARQADINYMIDPYWGRKLTGSEAEHIPEPLVTFRLQNVSARDVLGRML